MSQKNIRTGFNLSEPLQPNTEFQPKVLLVDDYVPNVVIAGTYLNYFGYEYDVATCGREALTMAEDSLYDAILMDIQMPEMDGIETSQHIREMEQQSGRARMPIIALTAHMLSGDRNTCLAAGMDAYIAKPFDPMHLKTVLDNFITRK